MHFNISQIMSTYQTLFKEPVNKYQSLCLELIKLWQENEPDELLFTCLMRKQIITEYKELVVSLGRKKGNSRLIRAIQESHPGRVVVGVVLERQAKCMGYTDYFHLGSLYAASRETYTQLQIAKQLANKIVIMDMGKRLISKNCLTNNMINTMYGFDIIGAIWLGQG